MATIKIAVINEYKSLTDAEIEPVVAALNIQVKQHFAPVWGIDADITYYKAGTTPPPHYWLLVIFDNSDQAGALGYHDLTKTGLPLGKVFAGTDKQYNASWSVTASHELLEMLGDPDIDLTALVEEDGGAGILYAYEICDACEDDRYGYNIKVKGKNILVSDFVYPSWFETFHPQGAQYDYQNKITQPFQVLPGGFIGVYEISKGSGWTLKTAQESGLQYRMRANIGSRRERRRTPRRQWLRSTVRNQQPVMAKTVASVAKTAASAGSRKTGVKAGMAMLAARQGFSGAATLTIDFRQGQGQISAELFRNGAQIDQGSNSNGGTITFTNAQSGDSISVEGTCTKTANLSIDAGTNPATPQTYPEGNILDGFDIL